MVCYCTRAERASCLCCTCENAKDFCCCSAKHRNVYCPAFKIGIEPQTCPDYKERKDENAQV